METHRERVRGLVQANPDLVDFTEGDPAWRDYSIWDMAEPEDRFSKLGWLVGETYRLNTCFEFDEHLDEVTWGVR